MKVTVISHSYPTDLNPVQAKFIQDQVMLFDDDTEVNIKVLVPTPRTLPFTKRHSRNTATILSANHMPERVPYISLPGKRLPRLIQHSLSGNLLGALRKEDRPALLHIHWLYPDAMAIPALQKAGFKTILTIHGSDWYQNAGQQKFDPIISEIFQAADRVLFSGPKLQKDILSVYPELTGKAAVIYNFVDSERYTLPAEQEQGESTTSLNWDPEAVHVLCVSNFKHEKGVDILVKAISELKTDKKTEFHIIGQADPDEPYTQQVLGSIKNLNSHKVTVHEPVPPEELTDYYHAADLFVLSSRREGFNVSLIEATACGLPVVATDVGGNFEIITKDTGYLVPPEDPSALAEKLGEIISELGTFEPGYISEDTLRRFSENQFRNNLKSVYEAVSES